MRHSRACLGVVAVTLVAVGCIEETERVGPTSQAIVGGRGSETDVAVGALLVKGRQSCSCTLIAPTVALTAAHCLPPHTPADVDDLAVFFGDNTELMDYVGDPIEVLDATPHPLWGPNILAYDIGLLRLAQPVHLEPARLSLRPPAATEQTARIVGFGVHTVGGAIHTFRRSGRASIDSIAPFSIRLVPGDAITCTGDSGGPALLVRDGVEYVAAVHSRSDCETRAIEERVDVHLATFIEPYLDAARACGTSPYCDLPCTGGDACEIACDEAGACDRPVAPDVDMGGCSLGTTGSGGAMWMIVLAVLAVLSSRRAAPRDRHPCRRRDRRGGVDVVAVSTGSGLAIR